MRDLPQIAREWMRYKKLAETTQHHCRCGGYHGNKVKHDIDNKNSDMSDRHDDSTMGSQNSAVPDRLGIRIDCEQNINHTQRPSSTSSRTDAQSDDTVIETEKLHHPGVIDNTIVTDKHQSYNEDSKTHACAKRLKMDKIIESNEDTWDSELLKR